VGRGTGTIRNDDLPSGTFALTPQNATVETGESITYTLTWTVPDPRVWRDLSTIDLRLIDDRANAIWLRWDEAANTFQLLNAREHLHGPSGHPGEPVRLTGNLATLDLEHSTVVGSGPTGRDVTLTLRLGLKRPASGHP